MFDRGTMISHTIDPTPDLEIATSPPPTDSLRFPGPVAVSPAQPPGSGTRPPQPSLRSPAETAARETPIEAPIGAQEPSRLSTSALEAELVGLAGHLAAAHCRWLLLLAEFDARSGWAGPGMRSCAHWFSWRVGMSVRTAMDQLRVGRALAALPKIAAVFAEGRISYSKVRAITRVATRDTEQTLLDLALAGTASHVERVVRLTRQGSANPAVVAARRELHWQFDDDGCLRLRATLPAEQGAQLIAAINDLVERHSPPSSTRSSSATCAETTSGEAADPLPARRADALVALASGSAPANTELVVHLNVHPDQHDQAEIEQGPGLPRPTAERLACDARARAVLADRRGNPLYLGRTRRLVSKVLLAALHYRDNQRCRFPGCAAVRHLQAHHIRHWLRGGRTDIDNLVLLCHHHHQLIHERAYRVDGSGTELVFSTPNGLPIPSTGPPTRGSVAELVEINDGHGGITGSDPLTPTWAGEPLDPTPILLRLLPRSALVA